MGKLLKFLFALILITLANISFAKDTKHQHHSNQQYQTALQLNDNKKWEMDEHTRSTFAQIENAFYTGDHSSYQTLNAIGEELQKLTDKLIQGCTMTGKAHDQLHIFLTNYIPAVDALEKSNDDKSAIEIAINLKHQLEQYKKYFK